MNPPQCCTPGPPSRRPSRWRRGGDVASWLIPGVTLVLLPKCPICMAAYVALFTGIGISFTSASILRTSLLVLSIAALLYLGLRHLRRQKIKPRSDHGSVSR